MVALLHINGLIKWWEVEVAGFDVNIRAWYTKK